MDTIYLASYFAKRSWELDRKTKSADEYYAEYSPGSIRQILPFISAVSAVGVWLVLLGLIPG